MDKCFLGTQTEQLVCGGCNTLLFYINGTVTLPVGQLRSRVGQRRSHIFGQNAEGYDRLPTSFRRLQQLRPDRGNNHCKVMGH